MALTPRAKPKGSAIENVPLEPNSDMPHVDMAKFRSETQYGTVFDFEALVVTLEPESIRWLDRNAKGWRDHVKVTKLNGSKLVDERVMADGDRSVIAAIVHDLAKELALKIVSMVKADDLLVSINDRKTAERHQSAVFDAIRSEANPNPRPVKKKAVPMYVFPVESHRK